MHMAQRRLPARAVTAVLLGAAGLTIVTASPAGAVVPPCGAFITVNTTLTGDMNCPGNGLTVNASGITLDLNGHTITGPGPDVRPAPGQIFAGVAVNPGRTNVVIKNGRIQAFTIAVTTRSSANFNEVTGLTLTNNGQGILTQTSAGGSAPFSDNNYFHHNTIEATTGANGASVLLFGSGHRFESNTVVNGRFNGVGVQGSGTAVTANTITGHGGTGVQVSGDSNVLRANVITGNAGNGANVGSPSATSVLQNNVIEGNEIVGNGSAPNQFAAINVISASGTSVTGNEIRGLSLGRGVSVSSNSSNTAITRNRLTLHTDGIFVAAGSTATSVTGNQASTNSDDGIDVDTPSASLFANSATANGDWGIEAVPGVPNAGNSAAGNGQPAQCLNVTCS